MEVIALTDFRYVSKIMLWISLLLYLFTHLPDRRVWPTLLVLRSRSRCLWGGAGGGSRWAASISRIASQQCHLDIGLSSEMQNILGVIDWYILGILLVVLAFVGHYFWGMFSSYILLTSYFGNAKRIIAHSDIMLFMYVCYQFWNVEWTTNLICYTLPHQCEWFVSVYDILTAKTCGKLNECIFMFIVVTHHSTSPIPD